METSLLNRVQATLLALATAALFVLAVFNLLQERQFQQPTTASGGARPRAGLWPSEFCPTCPASAPAFRPGSAHRASTTHPRRHSRRPGARALPRRHLRAARLHHYARRHSSRDAGQGHPRAAGPQPAARPARHRPHLSHHRLLRSLPPLGRAARHAFLSLLPGFVRAYALKYTGSSTLSTGPSSGPMSWPRRCSRRCFCILRSASLRNAQESQPPLAAAAGLRARRGAAGAVALVHCTRARPPSCCSTG